jgi:hypothetical protein
MAAEPLPAAPQTRRKFIIIDISGKPELVDHYAGLMLMQTEESVKFFQAAFTLAGKKKLPVVKVYETQAE